MKHNKLLPLLLLTIAAALPTRAQDSQPLRQLIRQHVYADYKQMFRQPTGGALIYPYLTPGSRQYANVLWDWDSWLSNVALRQTLTDIGTRKDRREALVYEQGCVLNYLAYTSPRRRLHAHGRRCR